MPRQKRKAIRSRQDLTWQAKHMYFVYVVQSLRDKSLYIGYTLDVNSRLKNHNEVKSPHTTKHIPYELLFYLAFKPGSDALRFEKYLKSGYGRRFLKSSMRDYFETEDSQTKRTTRTSTIGL